MKTKSSPLTVAALRKSGAKVRVIYHRYYSLPARKFLAHVPKGENPEDNIEVKDLPLKLESRGGITLIEVDLKNKNYYKTEVICSRKDSFNKKIALQIGCARIKKQMDQNGEVLS